MADQDYIPSEDDNFLNFQENLRERLHAKEDEDGEPSPAEEENYKKWSIPDEEVKELDETGKIYEKRYHRAQKKTKRNSGDVVKHRQAREEYEKDIREFVGERVRKNKKISDGERKLMQLTVPDTEPSSHPQIVDPIIGLTPFSGGNIEVRCRSTKDETRPSKPLPHILVQVQYALTAADNLTAPAFKQCTEHHESSKSLFIMKLGIDNVGKRFYGYFRWYDPIHEEDSGPWTQPHTAVLS